MIRELSIAHARRFHFELREQQGLLPAFFRHIFCTTTACSCML